MTRTRHNNLARAENLLGEALEAFENAMPKHLYVNGCFNKGLAEEPCPCTACKIRRYLNL